MPLECGIWSKLLTDYQRLISAIQIVINQYLADCGNSGSHNLEHKMLVGEFHDDTSGKRNSSAPIESESSKEINDIKVFNKLTAQLEEELKKLRTEANILEKEINTIGNQIQQKKSDNTVIEKAITNVDNNGS